MKFQVQFKDPDVVYDAARDAARENMPEGIESDEVEALLDGRTEKLTDFASTWIKYGEYITVEFDTEAKTCVVIPTKL